MCHSDYHLTTGATPIGLPALGGHEGAGVVTKVGKNVTGIEEGDHVILAFIPACGECPPCLKGYRSLCDRGAVLLGGKAIADGTSRVHAGTTEVSPMNLLGTFAPYMTVHKDSVVKIDRDIPFETAAIMGCAVPTGFGSATNVAQVQPGETVVIVGVGGIGMSALQGAVISGARNVIAIDPNEWKREQAIKFGATHVYPSMAEAIAPMIDVTHGLMADKTIIAVGEMKGEYIEEAMILTAKTGTCVVTGMGSMMDVDVKLNLFLFTMLQKTLKGNIFGGGSSHVETPKLVGLYKSGLLKIDEMVTTHLFVGEHQRRVRGHAGRQEHPRRHQVHRIRLVSQSRPTRSLAERPQLRGAQPVEHDGTHQFDVSRRGGRQRRSPGVGELDGRATAVVAAAVAVHQSAAAHPPQLVRQPALLPCQRLAEFVDPLRPPFGQAPPTRRSPTATVHSPAAAGGASQSAAGSPSSRYPRQICCCSSVSHTEYMTHHLCCRGQCRPPRLANREVMT